MLLNLQMPTVENFDRNKNYYTWEHDICWHFIFTTQTENILKKTCSNWGDFNVILNYGEIVNSFKLH
jgi:hypothetical protein